jgi:SAM-dependent methyltransferase
VDRSVGELAGRWERDLAAWAIPPEILSQAPESPWSHPPAHFRVGDALVVASASTAVELEVVRPGASVLDVGCGGGRASLALCPPATAVVGVDESRAMLDELHAAADERGVSATSHLGRWPDVAGTAPVADVVVCHHVAYNVPDVVPFLVELTAHARVAVGFELTMHHPQATWTAAWEHFWGLTRPTRPTAEDLRDLVVALGWEPEVWVHEQPSGDDPLADRGRAVRSTIRRLCLAPDRAGEVAAFLDAHPLSWPNPVMTLRWAGAAGG